MIILLYPTFSLTLQIHRGDLVIRKVSWGEMGEFTCVAANPLGTDTQSTFLYPLAVSQTTYEF